jgi:septin family protein
MTAGELADFREEVRSALQAASVALGRPIMHDFGAGAAASAGALRSVPPFAVVGAAAADLSVGPNWPVRVYPW